LLLELALAELLVDTALESPLAELLVDTALEFPLAELPVELPEFVSSPAGRIGSFADAQATRPAEGRRTDADSTEAPNEMRNIRAPLFER
jgi:hypothetical protein